jgi:hypothetical protein
MSLVQGGSANLPYTLASGNQASPTPIIANTSIPNALVATGVFLTADYTLISDGGALARPAACFIASQTFPMTVFNGTRLQLSLCEVQALIAMGAGRYS